MSDVNDARDAWEIVYGRMSPSTKLSLPPRAREGLLKDFEQKIGRKIPDDFISVYRIHDGLCFESDGWRNTLMSINEILRYRDTMKDVYLSWNEESYAKSDREVQSSWWDPAWVPIAEDGAGNSYCMDLNPTRYGRYGQIVSFWHDSPERRKVYDSIYDYMIYDMNVIKACPS